MLDSKHKQPIITGRNNYNDIGMNLLGVFYKNLRRHAHRNRNWNSYVAFTVKALD